jgi:hypothetical protein
MKNFNAEFFDFELIRIQGFGFLDPMQSGFPNLHHDIPEPAVRPLPMYLDFAPMPQAFRQREAMIEEPRPQNRRPD